MSKFLFVYGFILAAVTSCGMATQQNQSSKTKKTDGTDTIAESKSDSENTKIANLPREALSPPEDALATPSGAPYMILTQGTSSEKPQEHDLVNLHYTIWSGDGVFFDTTKKTPTPISVAPYRLLKPWAEGLQAMSKGEIRRIWVPHSLGKGLTPRFPFESAVIDVEIVSIIKRNEPPGKPININKPDKGSIFTETGIAYKKTKVVSRDTRPLISLIALKLNTLFGIVKAACLKALC